MMFEWFPSAQSIFDIFDFTCCMAAADCDTGNIIRHDHFMCALAGRYLEFNHKTRYPIASAVRIKKYMDKGFKMGKGQYLKIGLACCELNINSWDDLLDQLGGIYGDQIKLAKKDEGVFTWDAAWIAIEGAEFIEKEHEINPPANALMLLSEIYPDEFIDDEDIKPFIAEKTKCEFSN